LWSGGTEAAIEDHEGLFEEEDEAVRSAPQVSFDR
jgi:hypothetical protein